MEPKGEGQLAYSGFGDPYQSSEAVGKATKSCSVGEI